LQNNSTKELLTFVPQHFDGVTTITFSPDGQTLAGACMNQTVKLWDANTGSCKKILQGHTSSVKFVVFGCRGKLLASGSDDKTVRLWSVTDGKCLRTLEHDYNMWSVAFTDEGKTLATGCEDYKVHLWDVSTGFCDRKLQGIWIGYCQLLSVLKIIS
jgi:WD40 repeat protein